MAKSFLYTPAWRYPKLRRDSAVEVGILAYCTMLDRDQTTLSRECFTKNLTYSLAIGKESEGMEKV